MVWYGTIAKPFLCLNVRLFENILEIFQEIRLSVTWQYSVAQKPRSISDMSSSLVVPLAWCR